MEPIFNIFVFVEEGDVAREIGVVRHMQGGTDRSKIKYLQNRVEADYQRARRFPVPKGCIMIDEAGNKTAGAIRWAVFAELLRTNRHMDFLEPMFAAIGAPRMPLMVITAIVKGKPRIDGFLQLRPRP